MKRDDIISYLDKLEEMDKNNEWLPSPFEIEEYMDKCDRDNDLDLYDKLHEHYLMAYEQ